MRAKRSVSSDQQRTGRCLPGGAVLRLAQTQLADDSLHTVRIALREKPLEIFKGLDCAKFPGWRDVDDNRLVIA
jgi:hypothetical protein